MHVAMNIGTQPGVRCGVADYAHRLAQAFPHAGVSVSVFEGQKWSLAAIRDMLRDAERIGCDLVHIQYPAIGYGASLGPHALGYISKLPSVVTIHEYTLTHPLRKLSMAAFAGGVRHLVFTSIHERSAFNRAFPWSKRSSSIIPIGSNIPFLQSISQREMVIVFFGHIKPRRGLEPFLELSRISQLERRAYRFRIIGTPAPGQLDYLDSLKAQCADLPVEWKLDLDQDAVAHEMATSIAAYLPYSDGASPRRGSLLAVMGNGVPVVTTSGPLCPPGLGDAVLFASAPLEALRRIDSIVNGAGVAMRLQRGSAEYVKQFSWDSIAKRHAELYRALLRDVRMAHSGAK